MGCDKFIWIHNKIMTCSKCDIIIHAKCAQTLFEFNSFTKSWNCFECLAKPSKYNPFAELICDKYNPNSLEEVEDIAEISKILENSSHYTYSIKQFNKISKELYSDNSRIFFIFI